jgi:hypothetical protein
MTILSDASQRNNVRRPSDASQRNNVRRPIAKERSVEFLVQALPQQRTREKSQSASAEDGIVTGSPHSVRKDRL